MPGYVSMGHLANNSPVTLSSNLIMQSCPLDTSLNLPVHCGSCKFQSAAL